MVFMTEDLRRMAATGALAVLAATAAVGCGNGDDPSGAGTTSGGTSTIRVLAAFYPLAFVADRVGGSGAEVSNLTTPGVEPHDLELSPRQVGEITDANLVIYLKGFQPAVDAAIEQNAGGRVLDVTSAVSLDASGDPHFWLDPTNLAVVADVVAGSLAAATPSQAADFAQRAERLKAELASLDAEIRTGLATCQRTEFVTSHTAFGYLAERYGLEQIPIAGVSPDEEPSPSRIQEIQQLVRDRGVTTIFFETLISRDLATTIARDTGATTAVLDPVEGIKDTATDDYLSVMRANLAALRKALSCQ